MAIKYIKSVVCFGLGYNRQLPEGWKLVENPEDWARAHAPNGKEYLLGRFKAFEVVNGVPHMNRFVILPGAKELEKLKKRQLQNANS